MRLAARISSTASGRTRVSTPSPPTFMNRLSRASDFTRRMPSSDMP